MKERILYPLYYGPCGRLKTNDFSSVEIHKDDNANKVKSMHVLAFPFSKTLLKQTPVNSIFAYVEFVVEG